MQLNDSTDSGYPCHPSVGQAEPPLDCRPTDRRRIGQPRNLIYSGTVQMLTPSLHPD